MEFEVHICPFDRGNWKKLFRYASEFTVRIVGILKLILFIHFGEYKIVYIFNIVKYFPGFVILAINPAPFL